MEKIDDQQSATEQEAQGEDAKEVNWQPFFIMPEYVHKMEVPDELFHYTNALGLDGIISSQELWATHVQYMNDHKEFIYTYEVGRVKNFV